MEHTIEYTLNNDEIYKILEDEIVSLRIQPGDILSENSLCKRFHVSRTPIRSVLQRLQQNRFVNIIPHKGTIVTPINVNIASQLIYQRVAVESMVLRDFILSCSPTDVERVRYCLKNMEEAGLERLQDLEHFDINDFLLKRPRNARNLVPGNWENVSLESDYYPSRRLFPFYPSGYCRS